MSDQNKLTKINLYDKLNAAFVNLITPEMPALNKVRKQNNYSSQPTLERPFEMPFEFVSINGVKIRMAKSVLEGQKKETIVLLSAFPHTILAYSPIWDALKSDYNLYAYDLPGFGASEAGSAFMSFSFQGEFLASFLEHHGIARPHLVAPDVGMASALSYLTTHSHQVKSLMIGDGPAILPASEPSIMKKMVYSGFWRAMFVIAGSGALIESAKTWAMFNMCPINMRYQTTKGLIQEK